MIPFTLLGDTRRRVLAEQVRAGVDCWRRSWAEETNPRICVEISGGESFTGRWSSQNGFQAKSARGLGLYLFVAARCLPAIAGLRRWAFDSARGDAGAGGGGGGSGASAVVMGAGGAGGAAVVDRPVDPASLAGRLEQEALGQLARELLAAARAPMTSFERIPLGIRQAALTHHVVASITLGEAEATFSVALDPHLVGALLPPQAGFKHEERVEPRQAAIVEQTVGVEAVLGQTDVSIRDLAQLTVGDVIVMDELLSDAGSFQVEGGGRVGRISIGRFDGRRAVQFRGRSQ